MESYSVTQEMEPVIPWRFFVFIQLLMLITITATVVFTYAGAFPFDINLGVYRILPGDILLDFVWIYVLSILVSGIIYIVTPSVSILFWKGHRLLTRGNTSYKINTSNLQVTGSMQFRRLLLPAFIALGLSLALVNSENLVNLIFVSESFVDPYNAPLSIAYVMSIFFIMLLIASIIMILIAPIWLLQDGGILSERKSKGRSPSEVESVGSWYMKLLKGFASISTIIGYLIISIQTVEWYQFVLVSPPPGGFPIFIFFVPVIAMIMAPLFALGPISIAQISYEKSLKKNVKKLAHQLDNRN